MSNWYRPKDLSEALQIRSETDAIPLAGATDLYVRHRRGGGMAPALERPILYIAHLSELSGVEIGNKAIRIGAAAPYTDIMREPRVPEVLRAAIWELAAPALRNAGTMGGNICNASPAADAVCPLYALDAVCELRSKEGSRTLPITEVIAGPGRTVLKKDELLTSISFPRKPQGVWFYRKVGTRRANALSKLSIAAEARYQVGELTEVAIAIGAVAPTVVRVPELERELLGPVADLSTRAERVIAGYSEAISPIDDQRSTAGYRREVAVNLVRQFIQEKLLSREPALS